MKMHVRENKNAPLEKIITIISHHKYKKAKIIANIVIKDKFESVVVNIICYLVDIFPCLLSASFCQGWPKTKWPIDEYGCKTGCFCLLFEQLRGSLASSPFILVIRTKTTSFRQLVIWFWVTLDEMKRTYLCPVLIKFIKWIHDFLCSIHGTIQFTWIFQYLILVLNVFDIRL